jgi:hypothetical protein
VALGSVVLPPFSEGLVMGKIKGDYGRDLPGEVLIEPLELGTPGAYVARVASRVLTSQELSELKEQREECQNNDQGEIDTYELDRVKTGHQDDKTRYCILKILNTRGQHLELGKNVPLGQAEPLSCTPPKGAGIDFRSTGLRDMAAHRISSLTGRKSRGLREKRNQLEGKLEHLSPTEKHTLLSVLMIIWISFVMRNPECCQAPQKAITRFGQGTLCRLKRTLIECRMHSRRK